MTNDKTEFKVSPQTIDKINQWSDTILYREALDFISEQGTVDGQRQMMVLASYSQTWKELTDFVKHQRERNWTGRKTYYKQFYTALLTYFDGLRERVKSDWFPPSSELTKKETREWLDQHTILVAREFVQHLIAENLYREKIR